MNLWKHLKSWCWLENPLQGRDFWREFRLPAGFAVGVAAFGALLQQVGVYERFSLVDMDTLSRANATSLSSDIVMVTIGNSEYREMFGSKSPLNSDKVLSLIRAIHRAAPRVIGVDLETSDWDTNTVEALTHDPLPRVVWTMVGQESPAEITLPETHRAIAETKVAGLWMDQWGGHLRIAVPAAITDSDGILRRYYRTFWVQDRNGVLKVIPGFASALSGDRQPDKNSGDPSEPALIRFGGNGPRFKRIPAAVVETPRAQELFRGRTVLLGGTFWAARDKYVTPAGYLDGVEILAHAIDSERFGGITKATWYHSLALDCLVGLSLICLLLNAQPWFSLVAATLLAVIISLGLSQTLFATWGYFLDVAPAFGSALIGVVVEVVREAERSNFRH